MKKIKVNKMFGIFLFLVCYSLGLLVLNCYYETSIEPGTTNKLETTAQPCCQFESLTPLKLHCLSAPTPTIQENLNRLTVKELKVRAKQLKIPNYYRLKKAELILALE
jgi:hypothetical protein